MIYPYGLCPQKSASGGAWFFLSPSFVDNRSLARYQSSTMTVFNKFINLSSLCMIVHDYILQPCRVYACMYCEWNWNSTHPHEENTKMLCFYTAQSFRSKYKLTVSCTLWKFKGILFRNIADNEHSTPGSWYEQLKVSHDFFSECMVCNEYPTVCI